MVDGVVRGKERADFGIEAAFVGVQNSLVGSDDSGNVQLGSLVHMEGTDVPAALHQSHHSALASGAGLALALVLVGQSIGAHGRLSVGLAEVGFVGFHDRTGAAHWAEATSAHCFADAVRHEPCGL